MADDSLLVSSDTLIAGRYAVDPSQPLPAAGGGLQAYLARDRMMADARRVAIEVSRDASPRLRHLKLMDEPIDSLMTPLGHGIALNPAVKGESYFVICTSPPGPPVSQPLNPWPDRALIDLVLRPIAGVLDELDQRGLTHRAIRPNNVFQSAPGQLVCLGAAWAAPPAMHQPSVFEPPYSAMCHPACRGEGSIADDVYALGVLLMTLAGGKMPMARLDDGTAIRWKLDLGSFAALSGDLPLSGALADLLRLMLADDPDHRPAPRQIVELVNARGRRLTPRPVRRSQTALTLNDVTVFDARTLAYALLLDEKKAIQFLRNGLITQWLRRGLGDASLAAQIEDLVRGRLAESKAGPWSDPLLVMHTVTALNPRMPLCWRGIALWPDALYSMVAEGIASSPEMLTIAEELIVGDIFGAWTETRLRSSTRSESPEQQMQQQLLQAGARVGMLRLFYNMNPLLPCRASGMAGRWVATIPALMHHLENVAEKAGDSVLDLQTSAFIAARADRKLEMQVTALVSVKDADSFRMGELSLLRDLQSRYHPTPMPTLAKWVVTRLQPNLERWRNRPRRAALQQRLDALASQGLLSRLLDLAEDHSAWAQDSAGSERAVVEIARIDAEMSAIDHGERSRLADAERFGRAIAGGIGLSALIIALMSVLFR